MPNNGYSGQNLKIPVTNGTTPIHPQGANMPVAAKVINIIPPIMRKALSIVPTFGFIVCTFIVCGVSNHNQLLEPW